jgi:hypothetical protein
MKNIPALFLLVIAALLWCAPLCHAQTAVRSTTLSITCNDKDEVILANPAAALKVTLPGVEHGRVLTVKNIGTGTYAVTVDPPGSTTIDGAATYVLQNANQSVTLIGYSYAGTSTWKVVGRSNPALAYTTGAGGAVTQTGTATDTVISNTLSGAITTVVLTGAAGVDVSFTLTNSKIAATDVVVVSTKSYAGAADSIPIASVQATAAGSCVINIRNTGAVTLNALAVINFAVIKAVAN